MVDSVAAILSGGVDSSSSSFGTGYPFALQTIPFLSYRLDSLRKRKDDTEWAVEIVGKPLDFTVGSSFWRKHRGVAPSDRKKGGMHDLSGPVGCLPPIPIHPSSRKCLQFVTKGMTYQFRGLCFGLATSSLVLTSLPVDEEESITDTCVQEE